MWRQEHCKTTQKKNDNFYLYRCKLIFRLGIRVVLRCSCPHIFYWLLFTERSDAQPAIVAFSPYNSPRNHSALLLTSALLCINNGISAVRQQEFKWALTLMYLHGPNAFILSLPIPLILFVIIIMICSHMFLFWWRVSLRKQLSS